jgi:very-short-patch-repair endonuclease
MLDYDPRLKQSARRLRGAMTDAELRLWSRLRRKQIHLVQFYRQKPIGPYILDFYAPAAALVIEVDGAHHLERAQAVRDQRRTEYLRKQGLHVLRFSDREALLEIEGVVEAIAAEVQVRRKSP